MNVIYKSIWNEALGTYVAVAETAASGGRQTSSARRARRMPPRDPSNPILLEQRIVFDGALPATVGEVELSGAGSGDLALGLYDGTAGSIAPEPESAPAEPLADQPSISTSASAAPIDDSGNATEASTSIDLDSDAAQAVDPQASPGQAQEIAVAFVSDAVDGSQALTVDGIESESASDVETVQTSGGALLQPAVEIGPMTALEPILVKDTDTDTDTTMGMEPTTVRAGEIIFVDAVAADIGESLQAGASEVIFLDASRDGVEQIAQALEGRTDITAVHIISHGVEGRLMLGNAVLDADSIAGRYAGTLTQIGTSLSEDADILIYGCNFSEGEEGLNAARLLAEYTGADVAASDDTTGHESRGGDWDLEVQVGDVATTALAPLAWVGTLDLVIQNVGTVGATALANAILGAGVTVNSATYFGGADQAGIFTTGSGLQFGNNILEFTEGAIFTTNTNTTSVTGTNSAGNVSADAPNGVDGDPDFVALSSGISSFDASYIVIHFTPDVYSGASVGDTGRMTASIVFGSEEYNEYVYGGFNDNLGVWVNGINVALVPNGLAIGIDTINDAANVNPINGSVTNDPNPEHTSGGFESANANLYVNNEGGAYITQMDGFTVTLSLTFDVTIGQDNVIKLGIADTRDASYDSWLFIKAESLQTAFIAENDSVSTPTNEPVTFDVTANDVDQGGGTLSVVAINGTAVSPGSVVNLASGITLTMGAGGQITAQGDGIHPASDTFTYTVSNGNGQTTTAIVSVEMTDYNRAPLVDLDGAGGTVAAVGWNHNSPADTVTADQIVTSVVASAQDEMVGSGLGRIVADTRAQITGADSADYVSAVAAGDYLQYNFTTASAMNADTVISAFYNGDLSDSTEYQVAFEISTDNFTSSRTLIAKDLQAAVAGGAAYEGRYNDITDFALAAGTSYQLRTYIYATSGGTVYWDDFQIHTEVAIRDFSTTYAENGPAVSIAGAATFIADSDSTTVASSTVSLTNPQAGDRLLVAGSTAASGTLASGIAYTLSASEVAFTGAASLVDYAEAIKLVQFENSGETPSTVPRTLSVVVNDGLSNSNTAIATIYIDSAPDLNDDAFSGLRNRTIAGSVLANDTDLGDTPITSLSVTTSPTNGSLTSFDQNTGDFVYTPFNNFVGDDTFTYQVVDADGDTRTATVTVSVLAHNDAPSAVDDSFTVAEDGSVTIDVLANDSDLDGDTLTITEVDGEAITDGGAAVAVTNGSVALVAGELVFSPALNYNGPASFSYTVSDGALTATANVSGTVTPANDAPAASDDTFTVAEDGSVTIDVLANDSDLDGDALTITQVDGQAITDGGAAVAVTNGSVALVAGELVFSPAANFNGPASFNYTVSDGNLTATANVSGTVTPVNDAPAASDDTFTVAEDGSVTIDVLANDSDLDGDTLTITQVNGQAITDGGAAVAVTNGSVALVAGELVFSPALNYNGPASFSYTVSDGALTATANVSGTVTPANDAPAASDDTFTVAEDGSVTIGVLTNDSDLDGDILTITQVNGQAITDGGASVAVTNGSVALVAGELVFSPALNYNGPASFSYTVSDGALTATANVSGTVTPANDAPAASDDTFTVAEDGSVTIGVLTNDSDLDGDTLTITQVNGQAITDGGASVAVTNGSVALVAGELVFSPALNYNGPASFSYTVSDGALTATANVSGTVTPANDAPATSDDTFTVVEDSTVTIDVLANDNDLDGDTLTITEVDGQAITDGGAAVAVTNGSVALVAGELVFSPAVNYNGPASFSYTVSDGNLTVTANVSGTVTPVNDAPAASDDTFTVAEDGSVTIDVLANDSDLDGDTLTITQVNGQAITDGGAAVAVTNGSVALVAGELAFSPALNYNGPASFSYTVSDGALTATANVSGTVTPANDAPAASDDTFTVAEDGSVTIDVLANDSDLDGDALTITQVDGQAITDGGAAVAVTNGSVALVAGELVFSPAANFNGPASFNYTVSDGNLTATANVSGTVTPVNDAPAASDDTFTVAEDGSVTIDVLANDNDLDGDTLTITQVDGQAIIDGGASVAVTNGSVALVAGELVFSPALNYNGPASFSYTVSDGALTATANVSGTVTPANDAPAASDDTFTVAEDGSVTIDVLANDSDLDGDALTITQVDGQAITDGGAAVAVSNGSVALVAGELVFSPAANFNGPASFSYVVSDGALTATANVSGTVTPVNDAPAASDDTFTVAEDGSVTIDVLANDSDLDGDTLTITEVDGQAITDGGASVAVSNGSVALVAGELVFSPAVNYNGPASFSYTVSDGNLTATANVSGTVTPVNDAPVASDDSFTVAEDGSVTIDVLANDSDLDGDTLTITQVDGQAITDGGAAVAVTNGSVALVSGELVFSPTSNYNGPASFSYTVSDGNLTATANVSGTVTPVNDAPVASDDTFTVAEDGTVTIDVLANDSDLDGDTLTITQVDGQAITDGGAAVAVTNGSVALVAGELVFSPAANFNGPASFSYTVSDGNLTAIANVSGTVIPVNDAPAASDDAFTVAEDGSVTINVLANDSDLDGDALTITQVDGQAIADGGAAVAVTNGSVALVAGELVFSPAANFNGPASFNYTVSDGNLTATANVSGTVTPVNDAPATSDDTFTVVEDSTVTINVLANDNDLDGDTLTITQVDGQAITDGGAAVAVTNGSVALVAGELVFSPAANFNGPASFSYTVSDGNLTATANVSGTVTPVNDAPVASDDSFTVAEDGSVTIDVLANDSDLDGDTLTITQVDGQAITDGGAAVAVTNGSVALVSGELVFSPASNYSGPASFSYVVSDGALTATANVSGTVTPVNDTPAASDDTFTVAEDGSVTIDVLANDSDLDGDTLTITEVDGQAITDGGAAVAVTNGSVALVAGELVFSPALNYNGPASFSYTVSDGALTATANVSCTVTPVNDAPAASDDTFTVAEDGSVTIDVLANDSDLDGDTLTITQVDGQAIADGGAAVAVPNGSVALVAGELVFSPALNYNGSASFSYTVSDGALTATANVSGTVTPANDAPAASDDTFTVAEDGSVTIDVLANDSDLDGDALTITQVDGQAITDGGAAVAVSNGSVALVAGELVFSPTSNYNGPASFSYTVSDGNLTATANVSGTVTPVNDVPVASDDSFTVAEDGSVTIDVLANDSDLDGDTLTITQVNGQAITDGGASVAVTNGSVALVAGELVFSPALNYNGSASFSYTVSDGNLTATANVSGTVTPVNDAPVASDDTFTVAEDGSVTIDVLANDSDLDGDTLTITRVDGQAIADGGAAVAVPNGSVVLLDGKLVFRPKPDFNGAASFNYTISDGQRSTVGAINGVVTPVYKAPPPTVSLQPPPLVGPVLPPTELNPVSEVQPIYTAEPLVFNPVSLVQVSPEIHVLNAVEHSRVEASLLANGLAVDRGDRVLLSEALSQVADNLLLQSAEDANETILRWDASAGLEHQGVRPDVYVQRAVRHEILTPDHGLFVQRAVRASQLASRVEDVHIAERSAKLEPMVQWSVDGLDARGVKALQALEPFSESMPNQPTQIPALSEPAQDDGLEGQEPSVGESAEGQTMPPENSDFEVMPRSAAQGLRSQLRAFSLHRNGVVPPQAMQPSLKSSTG
jgi:large repetitive protein